MHKSFAWNRNLHTVTCMWRNIQGAWFQYLVIPQVVLSNYFWHLRIISNEGIYLVPVDWSQSLMSFLLVKLKTAIYKLYLEEVLGLDNVILYI